jgi:hypothetical protein
MTPSTFPARPRRSLVRTLGLALLVAALLGGLFPGPALSEDRDRRDRDQRNRRVYRPAPRYYSQPYGYYQPYGYSQPYSYYQAPPPVVYVPPPSPGISLFFGFPRR